MKKFATALVATLLLLPFAQSSVSASQPTAKKTKTFNLSVDVDRPTETRTFRLPNGRYRFVATDRTAPWLCDPGYEGCEAGEVHRCGYQFSINTAPNNKIGAGSHLEYMNWNKTNAKFEAPPRKISRKFYFKNYGGNQRFYLEVRAQAYEGLDATNPETCDVRVKIRKIK